MKTMTMMMVVVVAAARSEGLHGRPIHRWKDNINIVLKELEWEEGVD